MSKEAKKEIKFLPYTSDEDLPDYKIIYTRGDGKPPKVELAEPRYTAEVYMKNEGRGRWVKAYKLFAKQRHPRGIKTTTSKTLTPDRNHPTHVVLLEKLRAAGIPGTL